MSFRRRYAANYRRPLALGLFCLVAWTILETTRIHSTLTRRPSVQAQSRDNIFIASIHWNNERILRSHWINAVLDLVRELGNDHVYISIQESGSWDDSKGALRYLDDQLEKLQVPRRIILDPTTHLDEIKKGPAEPGWIETPRNKVEIRRISYLARLRNIAMEPLHELKSSGVTFDKVLFLNDVVFTTQDVRNLFATHDGDYAAACSLDFSQPPSFYDTFALRDVEGGDAIMPAWPYFRARGSRKALLANEDVPVRSCWNGMVVMDALPFYTHNLSFRSIPDGLASQHVEGSECCLIHADNPLSLSKGVWLNPNVRVGYNGSSYAAVNPKGPWLSWKDIVYGMWSNRISRWFTTTWFRDRIVAQRLDEWKRFDSRHDEEGTFCLINEMQVLVWDGWIHV